MYFTRDVAHTALASRPHPECTILQILHVAR